MPTSTLELIAIGQDLAAKFARLPAAERVIVAFVILGVVMGEFDEDQHKVLSDSACIEIVGAIRSAAAQGVLP